MRTHGPPHAHHRAQSPHVPNDVVLGGPALHALFDHGSDSRGALGQLLVAHHVHHRNAGRARDGVASVGASQAAGLGRVHDVGAADDP